MKKYFGKQNLVNVIRNKAGLHSDVDVILTGYSAFSNTENFVDFLSEHRGDSLYYSSEIMSIVGMSKLINEDDWQSGIRKIADEIPLIATKMTDFLMAYMTAFAGKYIAENIGDPSTTKFEIQDGPPIDTVNIPFFCAPPRAQSAVTRPA